MILQELRPADQSKSAHWLSPYLPPGSADQPMCSCPCNTSCPDSARAANTEAEEITDSSAQRRNSTGVAKQQPVSNVILVNYN